MKKIKTIFLLASALLCMSSCLKYNLEELPTYGDANITGINIVEYRYFSDDKSPVNGEKITKYVSLNFGNTKIDADSATCSFDVSAPASFPAERLSDLSLDKLVVIVQLSVAARCEPIEGAPAFGVPGDWTKPNKYKITAADGTTKIWTVTINNFTK